ncbi:MAG: peroxiredoxin family protein [Pyrinomonadaceae bacterium]
MKIILAALSILLFVFTAIGQSEQSPIVEKEFGYRDWTYKNLQGDGSTNLRDFSKGKKLVMVVYWAPWCPNWKHDAAFVQELHEKYATNGLGVIGVGMYDPVASMRTHVEQYKLTFPIVYGTEDRSARETTVHFAQRREAGDTRKWGSPWYVLLNPSTLERSGEFLTKTNTTVVNGELIKPEAEKFVRQNLGLNGDGAIRANAETSLEITLKNNSNAEINTRLQLTRLLERYDLSKWAFTKTVMIDEKAIPHSHPVLTLHTRHLKDDDLLLATYIHEQLHWFLSGRRKETESAIKDLKLLFPKVPVGFPEGGNDEESTYVHLIINFLENRAMQQLVGELKAKQVVDFWSVDHYTWVYRAIAQRGRDISTVIAKHNLFP